jgi:predicted unusual protein kinase regulating ubiquinone biosynthesis (AarF/ABC1/UbiB family)
MVVIGGNLVEFENVVVPQPVDDYTTTRVLTMDYVRGRKITAISPLRLIEVDGAALADALFRCYLKQILMDGIFHADPHPGNVYLSDGNDLVLLDLGMVGHVPQHLREPLVKLLVALGEGRGEAAARLAVSMGQRCDDADIHEFTRRVADLVDRNQTAPPGSVHAGAAVQQIKRHAAETGLRLPPEFNMIGKTLMNLDQVSRTLDPEFDPGTALRRHVAEVLARHARHSVTPGGVAQTVMDVTQLLRQLPERVNAVLDALAENRIRIRLDAIDEERLMKGAEKVANRITAGLVLAALIIGAAMLMRVETSFRIYGYPGLAMLLFLAAAAGGAALLINIMAQDRRTRR